MSEVTADVFAEYRTLCEERWGVKVVEKSDSWLMKAIAKILFFNKRFLTGYITTIGTTIYWPKADDLNHNDFSTLFHEAQHAYDYKRFPPWFILSYLSPQILTILMLLAFVALTGALWWFVFLGAVAFLAPFPSVFRTHWEMRGLGCGMAFRIWTTGSIIDRFKEFAVARFVGPDYYFMWPFKKWMRKKLARAEQKIRNGDLTEVQQATYEFLNTRGLVEADTDMPTTTG